MPSHLSPPCCAGCAATARDQLPEPGLGVRGGTASARSRSFRWHRTLGGEPMAATDIDIVTTLNKPPGAAPKMRRPHAVRAARSNRRLVVVSNRVGPIAAGKASEGGLAVALRAALENA